ncbi:hypothetical protein [Deinococcus petrolearius]|uniref:TrbL/VirB6 plasmid conjugal transfer protein n=1 Tax=Deinococcus petrolearius TaxID=1751295 RepID=A0ABW1DMT0_9DEIO
MNDTAPTRPSGLALLPRARALLLVLIGLALLTGHAGASSPGAQEAASGLETYLDITKVVPDLTQIHQWLEAIIIGLNIPGLSMLIARYIAGLSLILAVVLALINYATGKQLRLLGMSGSLTQMLLSVFVMGVMVTPLPFITGGLSYAFWETGYQAVSAKVDPLMTPLVKDKTAELGQAVFDFTMTSMAVAAAPMEAVMNTLSGDSSVTNPEALSGQMKDYVSDKQGLVNMNNTSTIWSLGMILIASMYLSYQVAVAFTMFLAMMIGLFFPIALASLPFNDRVLRLFIGSAVKNAIMGLILPALMLMNVVIAFTGPVTYLTAMMKNNAQVAGDAALSMSNTVNNCVSSLENSNIVTSLLSGVPGVSAVTDRLSSAGCATVAGFGSYVASLPKAVMFIIIGLVFTVLVFGAMTAFAQTAYKAVNRVIDMALDGVAEALGHARTGLGRKGMNMLSGGNRTMNRVGGAVALAAGASAGNVAVAQAGRQAMLTGSNPVTTTAGSLGIARADQVAGERRRAAQSAGNGGGSGGGSGNGNAGYGGGSGTTRTASNDRTLKDPATTQDPRSNTPDPKITR